MLAWNPHFTTGVPLVDSQHKVLFEQINRFEELMLTQPIPLDQLERVMKFLDSYSTTHFHFEEQCMLRHSCPAHGENRKAHEEFRLTLHEFKRSLQTQAPTVEQLREFHMYMSDWVRSHVATVDVKLRAAVTQVPTLTKPD